MRSFPTGLVCLTVLLATPGHEAYAQSLVGRWTGSPSPGASMTFEFRVDGTGTWNVVIPGNPRSSGTYEFEYRIDPGQVPMAIDLFGFDRNPLIGKGLFGIVRFEGRDVIFLDFQEGRIDPNIEPVRPVDFTTSTQRLERVERSR